MMLLKAIVVVAFTCIIVAPSFVLANAVANAAAAVINDTADAPVS